MTGRWLRLTPSRWPIRARLTLLYAASFAAAGAVLIAVTYILVSRSLSSSGPVEPDGLAAANGPGDVSAAELDRLLTRVPSLSEEQAEELMRDAEWLETLDEVTNAYRDETLSELLTWSLVGLAVALILAGGLGWLLAGRALRPLRQVTETAQRVADQNLDERIALDGPQDEIKELADTFDQMLERLDRSFDTQRSFVANASHELRTPLAVNRTLLEVAMGEPDISADLRNLGPSLLATNERSERLVDGLLTLSRSEQEVTQRTPVDLAEVAAAVVEQESGAAADRGVEITADVRPAPMSGNAVLIERMVANLVQNAARYADPGTVTITTGRDTGTARLTIENPGQPVRGE